MKKQFKRIALAMVLALTVSVLLPVNHMAEAAAKKTFTYAEQETGDKVTVLYMDKGEKIDLKFIGISDWRNYKYTWTSSNQKVATVNTAGVITAHQDGETTIELLVGDGSVYTSTGVKVYVGKKQEVTIGTAAVAALKSYVLEMGSSVALKANGIADNVGKRYTMEWSSTDTTKARIDSNGVVTTVEPGLTVIQLTVTKADTGEKISATPIALQVTAKGGATAAPVPTVRPTATPTPTPFYYPTATPTPTPFQYPTAVVTPMATDKYVRYTARLESDKSILLNFDSKVNYKVSDIELYQTIVAGNIVIPVKCEIAEVIADSTGKQLQVVPVNTLINGERYLIKAGSADSEGTAITVIIGEPNRVEITYECLGKQGVAYAYDEYSTIETPVQLSYRLYYGTVDVTETYKNKGYMYYEFAANRYYDNASIGDHTVSFYAPNVSVVVMGTFTFFGNNGISKEIKSTVSIRSQKLPSYSIIGVVGSTIIDTSTIGSGKIDWSQTTDKVLANNINAKLVAMIADSYGNFYVTDERGVDKSKNIYSVDDPEQLFAKLGYRVEFVPTDSSQILVGGDGSMFPFRSSIKTVVVVNLSNNGSGGTAGVSRSIGACQVQVLEESRLASVTAEKTSVTLAGMALPGFEDRFCTEDIRITLKDQYQNPWTGESYLEVTSSASEVNTALDNSIYSPARMIGNVLHVDANNIKRVTSRSVVTFYVTETITNRRVSVNVNLQNPTMLNGEIRVGSWSLGMKNQKIVIGDAENTDLIQYAQIEAYKLSNNGIKVGLYDDLHILQTTNYTFTPANCRVDEVYILVKDPSGKVVPVAANENSLGVYVDPVDHCVKVNVAAQTSSGSLIQEFLTAGTYTVMATRITNVSSVVQKTTQTTTFTVADQTKSVAFRSMNSMSTPLVVAGDSDKAGAKAIVESVLTFDLNGEPWTDLKSTQIADVDFVMNGSTIVIRKVEFAIPVNPNSVFGVSYLKSCTVNKAIKTGVTP